MFVTVASEGKKGESEVKGRERLRRKVARYDRLHRLACMWSGRVGRGKKGWERWGRDARWLQIQEWAKEIMSGGGAGAGARMRRQEAMEEMCRRGKEEAMGELQKTAVQMGCFPAEALRDELPLTRRVVKVRACGAAAGALAGASLHHLRADRRAQLSGVIPGHSPRAGRLGRRAAWEAWRSRCLAHCMTPAAYRGAPAAARRDRSR